MRKSDGTVLGGLSWRPVKIGGLGFATHGSIAADGSWMLLGGDVGGAYRRDSGVEAWTPIITSAFMTVPHTSSDIGLGNYDSGTYEAEIAPSNVNIALLAFRGRMLRTTNKGLAWVDDSLNGTTGLYMDTNQGNNRTTQHKLKHDTNNAAVAYLGTQKNGLWRRLTAGWSSIASVPAPTWATFGDEESTIIIAVDPSSTLTSAGADQRRSIVYASSAGNGIYKSTDGGTTFSLLANTPGVGATFKAYHMMCGPDGKLWVAVNNGAGQNLYHSADGGTTFTQHTNFPTTNLIQCIEIDPKNASRFVGTAEGKPFISTDATTTWALYQPLNVTFRANACPCFALEMEAEARAEVSNVGIIVPHPTLTREYFWGGWGVGYTTAWPGTGQQIWTEDTRGTEQMVTHSARVHPDGTTFMSAQDRGLIVQNPDRNKYAVSNYPRADISASLRTMLTWGTNSDYAIDDTNFIVFRNIRFGDDSGYSTDKGVTFHRFAVAPTAATGGSTAVSNKNQIVVFPGQNYWPRHSTDQGATWADCVFSGFTRIADGTENGWGFGDVTTNRRFVVCADKAHAGTFYAYNNGPASQASAKGIWKSTDGGANFTKVGSGPSLIAGQDPNWHLTLFITPNGHLFLHVGMVSNPYAEDANNPAFRSEDGGATWVQCGQINEPHLMAWGKEKPGGTVGYALYALAWKSGVFGLYRSDDKGVTWTATTQDPWYDLAYCLAADPTEFGRLVVGYSGTSFRESSYVHNVVVS